MRPVYINSYAQAEQLGFKPFDSMISVVVDADIAPKVKILAHSGDWTFSQNDARNKRFTIQLPNKEYRDWDSGQSYYAADKKSLFTLLDALFMTLPELDELSYKPVRLPAHSKKTVRGAHSPNQLKRKATAKLTSVRGVGK